MYNVYNFFASLISVYISLVLTQQTNQTFTIVILLKVSYTMCTIFTNVGQYLFSTAHSRQLYSLRFLVDMIHDNTSKFDKPLSHLLQLNGFPPVWVLKLHNCEKLLPQFWQLNGFFSCVDPPCHYWKDPKYVVMFLQNQYSMREKG